MKKALKRLLSYSPYTVNRRTHVNRFQSIEGALESLAARGFNPDHVLDGGANVGHFSNWILERFPSSRVYAVEPQPGCIEPLQSIAQSWPNGRMEIYQFALGNKVDNGKSVLLAASEISQSTGAHLVNSAEENSSTLSVPCITLDSLTKPIRRAGHGSWFIKLDLQGYELEALKGASETLQTTDVILSEVSFFAQSFEPSVAELISFLDDHGFELYDIASLYARPRDNRPRQGDFVFIRSTSDLAADTSWD